MKWPEGRVPKRKKDRELKKGGKHYRVTINRRQCIPYFKK